MTGEFIIALLAATVASAVPLLLAAVGELIAERAGILNLGVEGMMLMGAVTGIILTMSTGNHWWGAAAALLAGGAVSLIHAFISITLRGNQVVSGLALTIFGGGLSGFIGKAYVGVPITSRFSPVKIPYLSDLPGLGPVLFSQDALVYASLLLVFVLFVLMNRTSLGLSLRAAGEDPAAADASGINVYWVRYLATFVGGCLAGLGGAYLSLAFAPSWMEDMTAGRGWIAVALVIFGLWEPWKVMAGSFLFGMIEALAFRLQTIGITVSPFFLSMLPYIMTIVVLALVLRLKRGAAGPPRALSVPYDREER